MCSQSYLKNCRFSVSSLLYNSILNILFKIFCSYMEQLYKVGRIPSRRAATESRGEEIAKSLLLQGWAVKCIWRDDKQCLCQVPSQTDPTKMWEVDLVRVKCSCPASCQGGKQKNYEVAWFVSNLLLKYRNQIAKLVVPTVLQ